MRLLQLPSSMSGNRLPRLLFAAFVAVLLALPGVLSSAIPEPIKAEICGNYTDVNANQQYDPGVDQLIDDDGSGAADELCGDVTVDRINPLAANPTLWKTGDVFAGLSDGLGSYKVYNENGQLKHVLYLPVANAVPDWDMSGCAIDWTPKQNPDGSFSYRTDGDLWVTDFYGGVVYRIDGSNGGFVQDTATTGRRRMVAYIHTSERWLDQEVQTEVDSNPESVVFDLAGNVYLGHAGGRDATTGRDVQKYRQVYDTAGNLVSIEMLTRLDVPYTMQGADWIDLDQNQSKLYHTSEDIHIWQTEGGTSTVAAELSTDWNTNQLFAFRVLPPGDGSGGFIAAGTRFIFRLFPTALGLEPEWYDAQLPGGYDEDFWFAANLDPSGKKFYSGNMASGHFYRFKVGRGTPNAGPDGLVGSFDDAWDLGPIQTFDEVCGNGLDDNEDGQVDEATCNSNPLFLPNKVSPFGSPPQLLTGLCVKLERSAAMDACDNADNDLDGIPDNGCGPTASNDTYTVRQDETLTVDAPPLLTDPNNSTANKGVLENDSAPLEMTSSGPQAPRLNAKVVAGPTNGTLVSSFCQPNEDNTTGLCSNGAFEYTPNGGFVGNDTFTYRVSDGVTDGNTATVTVTVFPAIGEDDIATTPEDTPIDIPVLANDDASGGTLAISGTTPPTSGTISNFASNPTGPITYTPNAGFHGVDTFTYEVTKTLADSSTITGPATVTVTVTSENDRPVADADAYVIDEDQAFLAPSSPEATASAYASFKRQADAKVGANDATLLLGDSDPDGDQLWVHDEIPGNGLEVGPLQPAGAGQLVVNNDGTFDFFPALDFSGTVTFQYRATDTQDNPQAGNLSDYATVTITVTAVPDPPVAGDDEATTDEQVPKVIPVLGNDEDPDGDTLTVTAPTSTPNGTITVNPNGTITYTPVGEVATTIVDTFTYTIDDGTGRTDTATVTVTINPVKDPPDAVGDTASTPEDTPVTKAVLVNDTDADTPHSALAVTGIETNPSNGTAAINEDGSITYTPNENFNGIDTFQYTITDGDGGFDTTMVTITVVAVNDAPVADPQSVETPEETPKAITLAGSDPVEGSPVTFTGLTQPTHGTLTGTPPNLTYTPVADYDGPDSFTFKVNDGALDSAPATVSITVTPVNDPPVANSQSVTTAEDTPKPVTLAASDPDADGLTYTVGTPQHGDLSGTPPNLTYTPDLNYSGPDSFTFKVNDNTVDSNVATVSITVTSSNDPPVANPQSVTTPEDTAVVIALTGSDPENDTLSFAVQALPTHGTLSGVPPNVSYMPALNYNGSDSFTFIVKDGSLDSTPATVAITVTGANDPPVSLPDAYTIDEDNRILSPTSPQDSDVVAPPRPGFIRLDGGTIDGLVANDSDPDGGFPSVWNNGLGPSVTSFSPLDLQFSPPATDVAQVIVNTDGTFHFFPPRDYNGTVTFKYRPYDSTVTGPETLVTIYVLPVNDPPVAAPDSYSTDEDTTLTVGIPPGPGTGDEIQGVMVNDVDIDSTSLNALLVSSPSQGTLDPSFCESGNTTGLCLNGAFRYMPGANLVGQDTFQYKVSDGGEEGDSNVVTVTITVGSVNDLPVADPDAVETPEDTPINITLTGSDPVEGSPLTFMVVTPPTHGALSGAAPDLTYTPFENYNGPDSFTFKVNDGDDSLPATVGITVTPVNDPPVANDDAYSTGEDTQLNVPVTGVLGNDTDVEQSQLTAALVAGSGPNNGSLTLNSDGSFTYMPNANFNGTDTFRYTVSDGTATSNEATVTITVSDVNDPPVAVDDSYSVDEGQTLVVPVLTGALSNDSDPEDDPLTGNIAVPPPDGQGTVVWNTDGSFTYTPPDGDFSGDVTFTYELHAGGDIRIATITIHVNAVNDPPVADGQSVTTPEDTAKLITLTGSDVEGDTLTFSIVSPPTHGSLSVLTGADVTYTPAQDYVGPDSFTFKVNDGQADSNVATVDIDVTPVNDPPIANGQNLTTPEDTSLPISLTGSDPDTSSLNFTVTSGPSHGTLTGTAPNLTYEPETGYSGPDSFDFTVGDGEEIATATVNIDVTPVNDPPSADDQSVTTAEDTPKAMTLTGSDPEDSPLTFTIVTQPVHGVLTGTGANRTYTPATNYTGPDSFTFRVNDGSLNSGVATVSIDVTPENDAPVALDDSYTTPTNTALTTNAPGVMGNDSDVDSTGLSVSVATGPVSGALTLNADGSFTYTPNAGFSGTDTFTYTLTDGSLTDTATVTITVSASDGRMTGGGRFSTSGGGSGGSDDDSSDHDSDDHDSDDDDGDDNDSTDHRSADHDSGSSKTGSAATVVSHGFTLHCNPTDLPNRLEVNWGKGNKFHLELLTFAACSDAPGISEQNPVAGFDTYVGQGSGRLNGRPGATAEWTFTDAGEPGINDVARILIRNAAGDVVLDMQGSLQHGNHQAHPDGDTTVDPAVSFGGLSPGPTSKPPANVPKKTPTPNGNAPKK